MARSNARRADSDVSAAYVQSLFDHLTDLGLEPARVFRGDRAANGRDPAAIPLPHWLALLDRAMSATDDPDLALKVGESFRVKHLGHVGYVLMSCNTLGEAVEQAERYQRLIGGVGETRVSRRGENAELLLEWAVGAPPPAVERIFTAATATLSRWLADRPDLRWDAWYRCERPADLGNYDRLFGGQMRFGQSETKLGFPALYLDLPVSLANPEIHGLLTAQAEAMLRASGDEPAFVRQVKFTLSRDLAAGRGSLASVATALDLSPRTLHRRLEEHGRTFRDVMREVRCASAASHLRNPTVSIAEIAFMLGYTEQSTFQHAFKRWVGMTPGEFRARELRA